MGIVVNLCCMAASTKGPTSNGDANGNAAVDPCAQYIVDVLLESQPSMPAGALCCTFENAQAGTCRGMGIVVNLCRMAASTKGPTSNGDTNGSAAVDPCAQYIMDMLLEC